MKNTLVKIFKYTGNFPIIIVALILAALSAIMTIITPDKVGEITNIISDGLLTHIDMGAIAKIGILLIILYLIGALANFTQHCIMAQVTLKSAKRMRHDLSVKINKVPQKQFGETSTGDILSRITNDVYTLQQGMTNSLPTIISAITQFVGCLIMMFTTEWHLALAAVLIVMVGMVLILLIMTHSQKYFTAKQVALGELNGYIEEMYSGHDVVRISRAEEKVLNKFGKLNQKVYEANWKSQFLSGLMQPLMNVIGNIAYVAICVLGASLEMNGTIKFGVIVSFILYVRLFTAPLTQIAQAMTNLQTAVAGGKRIFEFMEAEELEDESDKKKHNSEDTIGAVEFDHVHFAYPENPDKIIIKDFCAKVQPGQKVAIVGPTGAGKTTMVNLLMRFFEINSGTITVDGTSIHDIAREDVHNMFGMVLQDTWLFEGTVRENLAFNMENISDEDIMRVAKVCGIDKFIKSLPHGLDTVLSESTTISEGQKQLLTIARAMLQDAPMLILDEATSSVDTRTEVIIQKAMDELTKGRTSFVIAHRLSTIRNADLILVMKDGDVIESGNHEELMEKGGFYSTLYNSQFEQAA